MEVGKEKLVIMSRTVWDIFLRRFVKVDNAVREPIYFNCIVESLRFEHIEALFLVALEDVKWDVLSRGPELILE